MHECQAHTHKEVEEDEDDEDEEDGELWHVFEGTLEWCRR